MSLEKSSISIDREKLVYKTDEHTFDFRKFNTIRTFGKDIYNGKIILEEADGCQSDLMYEIKTFNDKARPKATWHKEMKEDVLYNVNNLYEAREMVLNGFKSKIFLAESTGTGLFNTDNSTLKYQHPSKCFKDYL